MISLDRWGGAGLGKSNRLTAEYKNIVGDGGISDYLPIQAMAPRAVQPSELDFYGILS